MADAPNTNSPRPLDYHKEEPIPTGTAVGGVMAGAVTAVLAIGVVGFFAFFPAHPNFLGPPAGSQMTTIGRGFQIGFFALAVAAFTLTFRVWKSRPRSRWFFTGFLIGGGLMCLLEGACFSSP